MCFGTTVLTPSGGHVSKRRQSEQWAIGVRICSTSSTTALASMQHIPATLVVVARRLASDSGSTLWTLLTIPR